MRDTEAAFRWIVGILERRGIRYRISGGLAARAHGVTRELADIDIEVLDADLAKIADDVAPHAVFGPARYLDATWDLQLMRLVYAGQDIDLAGADMKIFDQGRWQSISDGLKEADVLDVYGLRVPVETAASLIEYKSRLGREVDLEDVRQLKRLGFS